jgi:hypothetical protein
MEQKIENQNVTVIYSLNNCKILSFSSIYNKEIEKNNFIHNFTFEINHTRTIKPENNTIEIYLNIIVFLEPEKKTFLGEISTLNIFGINNFDEVIQREGEGFKSPLILMAMFLGLSLSNTRGMLLGKAAGTCLQNAILPVINPTEFILNSEQKKIKNIE